MHTKTKRIIKQKSKGEQDFIIIMQALEFKKDKFEEEKLIAVSWERTRANFFPLSILVCYSIHINKHFMCT